MASIKSLKSMHVVWNSRDDFVPPLGYQEMLVYTCLFNVSNVSKPLNLYLYISDLQAAVFILLNLSCFLCSGLCCNCSPSQPLVCPYQDIHVCIMLHQFSITSHTKYINYWKLFIHIKNLKIIERFVKYLQVKS